MMPNEVTSTRGPFLRVDYDPARDIITIEGQRYTGELFRQWAAGGLDNGTLFKFLRNENGAISIGIEPDLEAEVQRLQKQLDTAYTIIDTVGMEALWAALTPQEDQ